MSRIAIVGGGFRGVAAAWMLRNTGHDVTLVEASDALGGVLRSIAWNGFALDLGCHLFDNSDDAETDAMLDLLGPAHHAVDVRYGSWIGASLSEGSAVPRLDDLGADESRAILGECLAALASPRRAPQDLAEAFRSRYGARAAAWLGEAARKAYGCAASELDASAVELGVFRRVGITADEIALVLKRLPELDAIVAARPSGDPLRFYRQRAGKRAFRNFYPSGGGIGEFGTRALRRLSELGVDVWLGHAVHSLHATQSRARVVLRERRGEALRELSCDSVVWALAPELLARHVPGAPQLEPLAHGVSLLLHYFAIPAWAAGPYTYLYDFRAGSRVFRASCPGNYGQGNCPDGQSYVCCEIPCTASELLAEHDETALRWSFDEARALGMHTATEPLAAHVLRAPSALRVPKRGCGDALARFELVLADHPRIACALEPAFTKTQIWQSTRALCERLDARRDRVAA